MTATAELTAPVLAPKYAKVKDVCKYTGMSRTAIYEAMGGGKLPFKRVGRTRLIRLDDVDKFIEQSTAEAAAE